MNDFQLMQLMDWAKNAEVDLAVIKDEDGKPVLVMIGEQEWVDELISILSED